MSYIAVVAAVTLAGFVTVQVLVPQFFEQGVQQRLGPGSDGVGSEQGNPGSSGQGNSDSPGQGNADAPGRGSSTATTTTSAPASSTTEPPTTTTTPTGSTLGPGGSGGGQGGSGGGGAVNGSGDTSQGTADGQDSAGTDSGNHGDTGGGAVTGTSGGPGTDAAGAALGVLAAPATATTELSPVPSEIQEEYDRALTSALIVATVIGLLIATGLGFFFTRRLLRTFNEIKGGARQLADGHYTTRVSAPRELELADLAESVNTLADSLQRTEETRARLVSDLAHELRNPLSTIEGYMEGLIDGVVPPSEETYAAVAAEAHRLKRLTHDLSTLSKAQEGALEFSIESIDLADVVASVVDALAPQYEVNEVAIEVAIEEPLPVQADFDRLAQALTNLLGNALAHTPPGGSVAVTGTSADGRCAVAIADTGSGIPASQLELIFERFTRLNRDQPGTGIGLNIARTLARAHGGDIKANSPGPGKGSTFTLQLPRRR